MFYKLNKVHLRQGIGREHLAMCGINLAFSLRSGKKVTCKNCRKVMHHMVKYNKFYKPFLR
ncbi:hypothetical protein LCGC14_1665320 [marine sediment metagenome]|uniref:Uncharacterized protein n=1 Tax=marine sediment metagenome TaxID=412755 RepID=A0A0F9K8P1_9ZZZZ